MPVCASCLKGRMNADPTPLSTTNKDEVIIQELIERFKVII